MVFRIRRSVNQQAGRKVTPLQQRAMPVRSRMKSSASQPLENAEDNEMGTLTAH
jgi:hypothetical protein